MGLSSTPAAREKACMTAHWPAPALVSEDADAFDLRRRLLKQLNPLSAQVVIELEEAGGVAARLRHAVGHAGANRIDGLREHDRYGAARLLQRGRGRAGAGKDHVGVKCDEFRRIFAKARYIALAPAGFDPQVPADLPARPLHPLQERRKTGLRVRLVGCGVHEHAYAPHAFTLLRSPHHRPRRRSTAEQRDKIASSHTRPHSSGGIVSAQASALIGAGTGFATAI